MQFHVLLKLWLQKMKHMLIYCSLKISSPTKCIASAKVFFGRTLKTKRVRMRICDRSLKTVRCIAGAGSRTTHYQRHSCMQFRSQSSSSTLSRRLFWGWWHRTTDTNRSQRKCMLALLICSGCHSSILAWSSKSSTWISPQTQTCLSCSKSMRSSLSIGTLKSAQLS